jgi:hypothetical protein
MERIKAIQQEILHLEVFKKLGELPSATRLYYDNLPYRDVDNKINVLRADIRNRIADIEKKHGVSSNRATMRFTASDEFKVLPKNRHSIFQD